MQLQAIKNISGSLPGRKVLIAGDFNIDEQKCFSFTYRYRHHFQLQNNLFNEINLIQQIDFTTGQRVINNVTKESIL